jgi:hypothetical protein
MKASVKKPFYPKTTMKNKKINKHNQKPVTQSTTKTNALNYKLTQSA